MDISAGEYIQKKNFILQSISLLSQDELKTKAGFVRELIELTIPVIQDGTISGWSIDKTAQYLWNEFEDNDVEISYRWFIELFPEDYKRKYLKSEDTTHLEHDYIKATTLDDGTLIKKCACGAYEIGGMEAMLAYPVPKIEKPKSILGTDLDTQNVPALGLIRLANQTTLQFLDIMRSFVKEFDVKCQNPKILEDLEHDMEYRDLAKMCNSLQHLFAPPTDVLFHEGGVIPSIMNQMKDEANFRAPVTMLQKGICYLLQSLTTYRQWAHKLSISPRQHQRVRERLDEWAPKKAEKIITNVLGSHRCSSCFFNLVSLKPKYGVKVTIDPVKFGKKKLDTITYGNSKYDIPQKYRNSKMNIIDIAYEVFAEKITLKK